MIFAASLLLAFTLRADPEVRPVTVPPALAAITSNPEFSGITWSAALGRYLLVSDDTGLHEDGTAHAPFVLALDEKGRLDETPVPIRGLASLNDPESICPGPAGTFFLVTSHSPNKKGKTKPARRQLLQLALNGRELEIVGRADLLAVQGGTLLERAGLPADRPLDIEAIAFRDGALFLGLKSPLADGKHAVIVRFADAEKALKEGVVRASSLTRLAALPLCVPVGAATVCQGVSDLLFLPDGFLVIAANAPKGGPKDGGGALWLAKAPVGSSPPVLVRRFENLKPEGLSLDSKGTKLVVAFDRDQEQPEWMELPLPETSPSPAPASRPK
ncbi:MAG: hypothetical protein QM765_08940 [Myxococcales bacterium]